MNISMSFFRWFDIIISQVINPAIYHPITSSKTCRHKTVNPVLLPILHGAGAAYLWKNRRSKAKLFLLVISSCLLFLSVAAQPPVITSFSPTSGPVGTIVTITGSNFNTTPTNNVVYFGAVKAVVSAASTTSLTVTVPVGATYRPLTVTTGNLTAYASASFAVSFPSNPAGITANSFAPKVDYVTGSNPANIVVSDLDGDGKADMISSNSGSNTVSVFRNTGNSGLISFAAKVDYTTSSGPTNVAAGDLDGDGKPDLIVVNSGLGTISVFKNTSIAGAISFAPKLDFAGGSSLNNVAVGDLNSDGKPDLVVGRSGASNIYVLKNTSTGGAISFNSPVNVFSAINHNRNIAIYDLNDDGKPELISDDGYSFVCVLRNTTTAGAISFAAGIIFTTGTDNHSVGICDLDGDGKPDIAEATSGSGISVFRNTGTGGAISFAAKVDFAAGFNPQSLDIGDLDGDGKPDIAVSNGSDSTVSILKNGSTGGTVAFAAKVSYAVRQYPYGIAVADLDGDGKPDLATANRDYSASTISVIRNQTDGPNIASFTPANAATGASVIVTGTNFTGATAVIIGGVAATSFTVDSDTQITAIVPGVTGGSIIVTTSNGSASLGGFYNGPTITSVSPVTGTAGGTVTITGTNFNPVAANNLVYAGAAKATVSAATATSLAVTVPVAMTYQPVSVTTGNRTAYSAQTFTVTFPSNATGLTANSFAAKTDYSIRQYSNAVVMGDLDGDGKVDMLSFSYNYGYISIFRNTGTAGTISFASPIYLDVATTITGVALGDLNGDGKMDIVATTYNPGITSVFRNTSSGSTISFAAKTDIAIDGGASVTISDIDGDGKPDLAVPVSGGGYIFLYRNTSAGSITSFATKINIPLSSITKVSFGDLDGDGRPEIVVANYYAATISVLKNTGLAGTFSFAAQADYAVGTKPVDVAITDVDGDGKLDLAISNSESSSVSVLRNTSTGGVPSFAPAINYATGSNPGTVSVADVDGDGKPDLAVVTTGSFSVSVLKNTSPVGAIAFAAKVDYITGYSISNVATGDLDGDGRPDLAITNGDQGILSILRNQTAGTDIFSFTPVNAPVGASLVITGINFTGATAVSLGGVAATGFTVNSDAQITAVVGGTSGGKVSVTTPKGTATLNGFYNGPAIISFSPTSGPIGTTVTINGTNFSPTAAGNTVYFGAVKAVVSAATTTTLTVTVPVGATYQPFTVTAGNATGYAGKPFLVTFPANIAAFTSNSFAAKQDYTASTNPGCVATGDLDGDGKPDMVVANTGTNSISIYKNNGTPGSVSFSTKLEIGNGYYPNSIAIGDINGDGKPDLAIIIYNSKSIYIYRNTSAGGTISFASEVEIYDIGSQAHGIAIGDLDGDGKPDLAIANLGMALFRNTSTAGTISFAPKQQFSEPGGHAYSIATGDIDGDGKSDLVVTNYPFYSNFLAVSVFKNVSVSGAISIGARTDYVLTAPFYSNAVDPYSVAIGDVDSDGKPDLAVANYNSNSVSVFRNQTVNNSISFAARVDYPSGTGPYQVSIGDFDGDEKPDLAVANAGSATISILKNSSTAGTIAFAAKADYATGTTPQSISVADLDGDGKPDLAIANAGSNTASVLVNLVGGPIITSFTPANGAVETTVTITGNRFTGATAVSFGGIAASSFTVVSDTEITAVVGGVAGGSVAVTTSLGITMLGGFYNGHSITSFLPVSGSVGTAVTITGSGFSPVAANNTVYFGAVKAAVSVAGNTSITVVIPAGATYQPITVTVNNLTVYTAKPFIVTFASNATVFTSNSFAAKKDYTTGVNPSNVVIGDLDGDGKPDLVTTNYNVYVASSTISVLKNVSTANAVSFAAKVDYTTGSTPFSVAIGDINGDGKPDLAVVNAGSNTVSILKNTSTGGAISFAPNVDFVTEYSPLGIAIGDLDGDGKPDLAVINTYYSFYSISVYKNTGTAGTISFAPRVNYATGNFPYSVMIGDVDGDGKPELIVANANSYSISVFRNTCTVGVISFAAKTDYPAGTTPYSVAIGDVDGDGKPDLVTANGGSNTVSVLRNTSIAGTVSFATKLDYTTGADPRGITITDMDGDGKPDLAVANNSSGTLSLLKNGSTSGTIAFAAKVDYTTGINPRGISAGDLTGDGKPDLITANFSSNTVSILRNDLSSPELCPGGNISFTSNVTGASYQWQVNTGSGFTNISDNSNFTGTNTVTLQLTNIPSAWYGYQYRCVVDGGNSNIFILKFTNTWTGVINSAWENGGNWSCGVVPDGNTDVMINAGTVIISSSAVCRSIKVNPGISFTITNGYNLIITH